MTTITVTIRLFAVVRERVGVSELALALPAAATVATARDALLVKYPTLAGVMARVAFAVNCSYAPLKTELNDGDELAVIPPVSGGYS